MSVADRRLAFYDAGEPARHGSRDLAGDIASLRPLLRALPAGSLVAEVGCGPGRLADVHPGWLGLDLGHAVLARSVPGRSAQADACALPLADGSAAAVISVQTLEHIPDPDGAMREIARVLAPGGIVYLRPAWYCSAWPMHPLRTADPRRLAPLPRARRVAAALRYSPAARAPAVLVRKAVGELRHRGRRHRPGRLPHTRLAPRLDRFHISDSDASAGLEPADLARWLEARGFRLLTFGTTRERLTRTRGAVVARGPGDPAGPADAAPRPLSRLACPRCRGGLGHHGPGHLSCAAGHRYPVEDGVPRLVAAYRDD